MDRYNYEDWKFLMRISIQGAAVARMALDHTAAGKDLTEADMKSIGRAAAEISWMWDSTTAP